MRKQFQSQLLSQHTLRVYSLPEYELMRLPPLLGLNLIYSNNR